MCICCIICKIFKKKILIGNFNQCKVNIRKVSILNKTVFLKLLNTENKWVLSWIVGRPEGVGLGVNQSDSRSSSELYLKTNSVVILY